MANKANRTTGNVQQKQNGHNRQGREYQFLTNRAEDGTYEIRMKLPSGERYVIGKFVLPCDNQLIQDNSALSNIRNALRERWLFPKNNVGVPNKAECCYYDIWFEQAGAGIYLFYLPDGILIGAVYTPNDMRYDNDLLLIKEACRQLAYRYGLK